MENLRIDVKALLLFALCFLPIQHTYASIHHHTFVVKSSSYSRLCHTKRILTVNGRFPGPTLKAHRGDRLIIKVYNMAKYNITLHWHGLRQMRNPWSDGPQYVTQCPIRPGNNFSYVIEVSSEEGTLWWHAHSGWARATVYGAIIVYPRLGTHYPFLAPSHEFRILLGEWWKKDVMAIPDNMKKTGGEPILSDAYTINGQPGHLYPCSREGMYKMRVGFEKIYLLRIINMVMDEEMFFSIAKHNLTIVGTDGSYTKPFQTDYIMISPGQTMDVLLKANQDPSHQYYVASRSYSSAFGAGFDKTTTTAMLHYHYNHHHHQTLNSSTFFPTLPPYNSTLATTLFTKQLRSLANKAHPANVPLKIDTNLFFTLSVNLVNCSATKPCTGPFGKRFYASVNNVSFVTPSTDMLRAYYHGEQEGVFDDDFPRHPVHKFNYTGRGSAQDTLLTPEFGTKVVVLEYGSGVELVLQGTNVLASDNHPVHLHGHNFFVVGYGFGNFDPQKDPLKYNLVDPPEENTVGVPNAGWVALRFKADNPGVWLMHCHLERHQIWGMSMVFVVKNGATPETRILPPPPDLPNC